MALNPFFLKGSKNEQLLVQDLINEHLKIYGIDVLYLPRKIFNKDDILKEIQSTTFYDSFTIEAYLNNYDGYAPDSDIMTKFGLRLKNEINLTISRERFEEFIVPFLDVLKDKVNEDLINILKSEYDLTELATRPKEGDLIYFPLGQRLFEIKRVESEKPFYQLGTNYIYELSCELFEYENEVFDTSVEEIDSIINEEGYITSITLVGSAVTCFALAEISSGGSVVEVFLNNDGYGYTSTPKVLFTDPNSGFGTNAKAVAITTTKNNIRSIERIELTDSGFGYLSPPTISIIGGGGSGAIATCSIAPIDQFSVRNISIQNSGKGYMFNPSVSIVGNVGSGITASAVSVVKNDGSIDSVRITNSGFGYTESPKVIFTDFPTIGVGTYVFNEEVIGETSGTVARVREFKYVGPKDPDYLSSASMKVSLNNGKFIPGEILVGTISSARYMILSYNTNSYKNSFDSNEEIEIEADEIIDFTESNPFGVY